MAFFASTSLLIQCVNPDGAGAGSELARARVLVLTRLVALHGDLNTEPAHDMTRAVCSALAAARVSHVSWLRVVTSLSDDIFLRQPELLVSGHHWAMVQAGLVSEDGLTRKRSMFLLKRTLDTVTSDLGRVEDGSGLVSGDKSSARENFDNYFLVLETLEEKQVHLVRQVVAKIQQLLHLSTGAGGVRFHPSWILILFLRVFHHPNIAIVR